MRTAKPFVFCLGHSSSMNFDSPSLDLESFSFQCGARKNATLWKRRIAQECNGIVPHRPVPSNISIKFQHDLGLRSLHHLCFCKKDSSQKACRKTVHSCSVRLGSSRVGWYLIRENLPKRMLTKFSRLVETLKRRIPAIDRGILFREPTRLHIVNQTRSALSLTWWTPPFRNAYIRMCFHICCLNQTLKENDSSKYRLHPTDSTHHYQPWGVIWYDSKFKLCL